MTRAAIRWMISFLAATIGATVVVSLFLVTVDAVRNAYTSTVFYNLILFSASCRFQELLLPSILLSLAVACTALIIIEVRRSGRRYQIAAGMFACIIGVFLFVFQEEIGARFYESGIPLILVNPFIALVEENTWTWVAVIAIAMILSVFPRKRSEAFSWWNTCRIPVALVAVGFVLILAAWISRSRLNDRLANRWNIVLIVLDTVGANHMASYGYHRVTTPEIDRLARRGILFTNAYAVAPWTLPSHASMFTGLYSVQHGATQEHLKLEYKFHTVAEVLGNEGYRTFASVNNAVLNKSCQMHQGFAEYLPMWRRVLHATFQRNGENPINNTVKRFLNTINRQDRFFIFLNYIDAHTPYYPEPPFRAKFLPKNFNEADIQKIDQSWQKYYTGQNPLSQYEFGILNDLYDGELLYLSKTIDELIAIFDQRRLLENTLVIITSDHGENIGEHGHFDHVFCIYNTLLRVPLIILEPKGNGDRKAHKLAASVDIFKTILDAAQSNYETGRLPGRNLLTLDESSTEKDVHLAEYYYPSQLLSVIPTEMLKGNLNRLRPYLRRTRSIQTEGWKLIWGSDGRNELYNIENDPDENVNLVESESERVRLFTKLLEERLEALTGRKNVLQNDRFQKNGRGFEGIDDETRERLRSLGYVQ